MILSPELVDSPVAEGRVRLVDRVPVCGPLLPRVRRVDAVRQYGPWPSAQAGRSGQQSPH